MSRPRNNRIGRNDPCHCGSGKKHKHCHGELPPIPIRRGPLPREIEMEIQKRRAEESRRESIQGLGKPIIGTRFKGYQFVGVGNTLRYGKWKTFFDFLDDYIKNSLGPNWGNAELSKPHEQRHPILQWYHAMAVYKNSVVTRPGRIHTAPMTGATAAYYSLAYNLYLLEHNVELQRRLLARLRNPEQFRGAYYETFVAACCILAGFELELEDEGNPSKTHCEFSARSKASGKSYSVEAKSRAPNKANSDIGNQLYAALGKDATYPRIVFIDVNLPNDTNGEARWFNEVVPAVKNREPKMTINQQPAPPAFVIVTNLPYHYDLEGTGTGRAALALGFKIKDFGVTAEFDGLIPAFKAKQKYADLFGIMDTIRRYHIPSTFDGELPEFAFGEAERRWIIGERYDLSQFEEGAIGILSAANVSEQDKTAFLAYNLHDGRNVLMQARLTDAELAAYLQHPETFFGVYQRAGKQLSDPLSLFEFFHEAYMNAPRDRLLDFLKSSCDFEELSKLPTDELLLVFCDRHVSAVMKNNHPDN